MDKVCLFLNRRKQVHAYIPQMEKYIASKETMILQVMFPGYVFVETTLDQLEFDAFLSSMDEEKDGIIRELRKEDVSALTDDEKDEYIASLPPTTKYVINRNKGLGEMDKEELCDTTMNIEHRTLRKITIEDAMLADQVFETLMGEEVEPRRQFIEENAQYVSNLDI